MICERPSFFVFFFGVQWSGSEVTWVVKLGYTTKKRVEGYKAKTRWLGYKAKKRWLVGKGWTRLYRFSEDDLYGNITPTMIVHLVSKGIMVGILAGCGGASFRYAIQYAETLRRWVMNPQSEISILFWVVAVCLMGICSHLLLRWAPLSGGSGIPQIEGEILGLFSMQPGRTFLSKYIGGVLNGLVGFSLGREGPSVQIGGSLGKIVARWFSSSPQEERILISAGSAAGLTAAFSAPLSGAIFVFEEMHKSFYSLLVIPTFTAALVSNFITSIIFGLKPSLGFSVQGGLPLRYYAYLLLLGVLVGAVGILFNHALLSYKYMYSRLTCPSWFKTVATFATVGMVGYDIQFLLGGGNELVLGMAQERYGLSFLVAILVGKILLTTVCFGSGVQGGIFLPMLVIGAATGGVMSEWLVQQGLLQSAYVANFVLCAMGGMLAASVRSPLLSILLVMEMTDSFANMYAVSTVTIVAYLVAEMAKEVPIYEALLQAMLDRPALHGPEQTFFQSHVSLVSPLVGKPLKDIQWPKGMLVVSIERHDRRIVPMADTTLQVGDVLHVSCLKNKLEEAKHFLNE